MWSNPLKKKINGFQIFQDNCFEVVFTTFVPCEHVSQHFLEKINILSFMTNYRLFNQKVEIYNLKYTTIERL